MTRDHKYSSPGIAGIRAFAMLSAILIFTAGVYEYKEQEQGTAGLFLNARKTAGLSYRINGRRVKAHKYLSEMDQGDVIGWYLSECAEKGLAPDESARVRAMAASFIDAVKNPGFDYVYFAEKDGTGRLVAAANLEKGCEIAELEINPKPEAGAEKGFNDALKHYPAAEKVMSMEIMEGGRTVNFSNFYSCRGCALNETGSYYEKNLPLSGWQVTGKSGAVSESGYVIFINKDGEERVIMLTGQGDELWINVMG